MTGLFELRDLGRMEYTAAFDLQKELQREVIESRAMKPQSVGHLLLVEHDPPVITISRRKTARQHLIAGDEQLAAAGVQIAQTDRGGDITYHGPGQLVVYPIFDLNRLHLRLHSYMRFLEQIVIDVLARWGIEGQRDPGATGVWTERPGTPVPGTRQVNKSTSQQVDGSQISDFKSQISDQHPFSHAHHSAHSTQHPGQPRTSSKIAAMGVRISRWVSMHGLALNVMTDLSHFDLIVPCGLAGRTVTSMQQLLGDACPTMDEVKQEMVSAFEAACGEFATHSE